MQYCLFPAILEHALARFAPPALFPSYPVIHFCDSFDFIDSSDLSESLGILNVVMATSPLLKATPHATLRTDLLRKATKAPLTLTQYPGGDASIPADVEDDWCITRVYESAILLGERYA